MIAVSADDIHSNHYPLKTKAKQASLLALETALDGKTADNESMR